MSDRLPFPVQNPEFEYSLDKQIPNYHHHAGFSVEFGHPHGKYATQSVLDIETSNRSGYGMNIAIQMNWDGEWMEVTEANRVRIAIFGDYERGDLIKFLQQAGLLTLPVYGKMETSNEE
jgi:hypothetical protein